MTFTDSDKIKKALSLATPLEAALRREGIPIVAEDTGLNYGRTVFFYPETGIMEIRAASMGNKQL